MTLRKGVKQMAITISIGRGVGVDDELSDSDWADYMDALEHAVWDARLTVYFRGVGLGNGEWGAEEAYTIVAEAPQFGDERRELFDRLERIRTLYAQEAVAVTEGKTEFV